MVARLVVDLRRELDGCQDPVAFGIANDGTVLAAGPLSPEPAHFKQRGCSFAKSHFDQPSTYRILAWHNGRLRKLELGQEPLVLSYIQPMRAGLLLVSARCDWSPRQIEKNALILGWDGKRRRRLSLGDGIEDVRTTPEGTIWVSYFDEGVVGNRGWNHPGPAPIGATGLVAFDRKGSVRWSYDARRAGTDSIVDVYALNVRGADDVWLYFYTEFSIVHVTAGRC
jgi:hypothetical protein